MMSVIQWALAHDFPSSELVPMLNKLLRYAEPSSRAAVFAKRKLAELLVQDNPWRSALLARELLHGGEETGADERIWALLGLAQTLLGNYRAAVSAYRQAMARAPDFPMCAHNLGHLLDAALDRPQDALRYLKQAYTAFPNEPEIGSSYAHALARAGHHAHAKAVLAQALDGDAKAAEELLTGWLRSDPPGAPLPLVSSEGR
jgi:tetratricopeptide (TPR) repeat protein